MYCLFCLFVEFVLHYLTNAIASNIQALSSDRSVAESMVTKALKQRPPFFIYFGLDGWMLQQLTAGMSPVTGLVDGMCQVFLMGLFRFISLFYLWDFDRIIAKCEKEKKE